MADGMENGGGGREAGGLGQLAIAVRSQLRTHPRPPIQSACLVCELVFTDADLRALPSSHDRLQRHSAYYEADDFHTVALVPQHEPHHGGAVIWTNVPSAIAERLSLPVPLRIYSMTSRQHQQGSLAAPDSFGQFMRHAHWLSRVNGGPLINAPETLYGDEPSVRVLSHFQDMNQVRKARHHAALSLALDPADRLRCYTQADQVGVLLRDLTRQADPEIVKVLLAELHQRVCGSDSGVEAFLSQDWRLSMEHLLSSFPCGPAEGEVLADTLQFLATLFQFSAVTGWYRSAAHAGWTCVALCLSGTSHPHFLLFCAPPTRGVSSQQTTFCGSELGQSRGCISCWTKASILGKQLSGKQRRHRREDCKRRQCRCW